MEDHKKIFGAFSGTMNYCLKNHKEFSRGANYHLKMRDELSGILNYHENAGKLP